MRRKLKFVLACWFVLQILLPFTAPLETCGLADLLAGSHQHDAPLSPESTSTPPAAAPAVFVSPLDSAVLAVAASLRAASRDDGSRLPILAVPHGSAPEVQHTILRV